MKSFTNASIFEVHTLGGNEGVLLEKKNLPNVATFELIWIKKGDGLVVVDSERLKIADDTLFFLRSGHLNRVQDCTQLSGYRIAFSRDFLASSSGTSALPSILNYSENGRSWLAVSLDQNARLELENIVSLILDECQYDHTLKADVLQGCLKIIIAYFTRLADISDTKTTSTHDQILFNAFMAKVEEQFYLRKMVSDYASELAVSPNYLSEVVRRVTGHSAGYHIRQRVLSEAKRMALNTATAVKQIAFELGFEDASTFSKFFKAEAGVNFTEFRSRHFG